MCSLVFSYAQVPQVILGRSLVGVLYFWSQDLLWLSLQPLRGHHLSTWSPQLLQSCVGQCDIFRVTEGIFILITVNFTYRQLAHLKQQFSSDPGSPTCRSHRLQGCTYCMKLSDNFHHHQSLIFTTVAALLLWVPSTNSALASTIKDAPDTLGLCTIFRYVYKMRVSILNGSYYTEKFGKL